MVIVTVPAAEKRVPDVGGHKVQAATPAARGKATGRKRRALLELLDQVATSAGSPQPPTPGAVEVGFRTLNLNGQECTFNARFAVNQHTPRLMRCTRCTGHI